MIVAESGSVVGFRQFVVVSLLVCVALVSGVTWTHVHPIGPPGLYDARCPSCELAHHTAGPPLSSPETALLDPAPVIALLAAGPSPVQELPGTSAPRAPPLG
jgi:hypothetical protein